MTQAGPGVYLDGKSELKVRRYPNVFAYSEASYEDAFFVIAGLPYDRTVSHRFGTALAPDAIRQATWNSETWNVRNRVSLKDLPMHDMGDLDIGQLPPNDMFTAVQSAASHLVHDGKFPLFLGGEHSTVPGVVHALKEKYADLGVIQIDAHLDYRRDFHDNRHNHACAMRRIGEAVGADKMVGIGIRSVDEEEHGEAIRDGFKFFTSYDVERTGISQILHEAIKHLDTPNIYLTIDIDGIDPAYAPATGTPEPFGLTPFDVLKTVNRLAPQLVGFDINEVSPPWDTGNTAELAAKIAREALTEIWLAHPELHKR